MAQSKSQKFSEEVFKRVTGQVQALGQGTKELKKYKSLCKRSGGMMRTVGLIQFLAFLQARGQRAAERQNLHLLEDLRTSVVALGLSSRGDVNGWMNEVRAMALPSYMHLTREILRLLDWYKRLADILIEGNADDTKGEED